MKQMLQVLRELKQAGQLAEVVANFDKAEGVNRGRIQAALRATDLRGKPDAYKIFMADEAMRLELSGVEPEGRTAIERALLSNKDD